MIRFTGRAFQTLIHLGLSSPPQTLSFEIRPFSTIFTIAVLNSMTQTLSAHPGLEKTMPKRCAAEADNSVFLVNKKQHLQVTDSLAVDNSFKMDIMPLRESVKSSGDHAEENCALNFDISSSSSNQKNNLYASPVHEDSGIETTPDADRALTCTPNVPGFLLMPRPSFPAPKFDCFDSVSSDPVAPPHSVEPVDHKPMTAVTETDNFSDKSERVAVNNGGCPHAAVPYVAPDNVNSNANILESGQVMGADLNSVTAVDIIDSKTLTSADKVKTSGSSDTILGSVDHSKRDQQKEKSKAEPAAYRQTQSAKNADKNLAVTTTRNKKKSPKTTARERKTSERERESHQALSKAGEKLSTAATGCQSEVTNALSNSAWKRRGNKRTKECQNFPSAPKAKKGKGTVLPAALLNQVVKIVQDKVKTVTTQVMATSAAEPPSAGTVPLNFVAGVDTSGKTDRTTLLDPASDVMQTVQDEDVLSHCQTARSHSKTDNLGNINSNLEKESGTSKTAEESDTQVKTITMPTDGMSLSGPGAFEESSSDAVSREISVMKLGDEGVNINPEASDLEKSLQSVLPVDCVETEAVINCDKKKKSKKAKKKRKSRGQRKSTGSECESMLGVLPKYIPENDSRVNKNRADKVYNLSTLFSGKLGGNQPPKANKRPNYFFAVQITNPVIKSGLSAVQKSVEEAKPELKAAFVSADSAHLTLAAIHLPDEEAINRAKVVLDEVKELLQQQKNRQLQQSHETGEVTDADSQQSEEGGEVIDANGQQQFGEIGEVTDADRQQQSDGGKVTGADRQQQSDERGTITDRAGQQQPDEGGKSTNANRQQSEEGKERTDINRQQQSEKGEKETDANRKQQSDDFCEGTGAKNQQQFDESDEGTAADKQQSDEGGERTAADKQQQSDEGGERTDADKQQSDEGGERTDADKQQQSGEVAERTDADKQQSDEGGERTDTNRQQQSDEGGERTDANRQQQSDEGEEETDAKRQQQQSDEGEEGTDAASPLIFEVKGLDHFQHKVVFAKVSEGKALDQLKAIAAAVRAGAMKQDISMDPKDFAAHVTIMKLTKNAWKLKKAGIKKINAEVYQASSSTHFGNQTVTSIQLCSMLKRKQNNYYYIEYEVTV